MNEQELKAALQNSPKSIGATSGTLLVIAVLLIVHRGYHAHVTGIVLWKGVMAGAFLAMLAGMAAFRLHRREKWFYWLLLAVAVVVSGGSALHVVAEIVRKVDGASVDYVALTMTAAFAFLSGVVVRNLVGREAREFFAGQEERTS